MLKTYSPPNSIVFAESDLWGNDPRLTMEAVNVKEEEQPFVPSSPDYALNRSLQQLVGLDISVYSDHYPHEMCEFAVSGASQRFCYLDVNIDGAIYQLATGMKSLQPEAICGRYRLSTITDVGTKTASGGLYSQLQFNHIGPSDYSGVELTIDLYTQYDPFGKPGTKDSTDDIEGRRIEKSLNIIQDRLNGRK